MPPKNPLEVKDLQNNGQQAKSDNSQSVLVSTVLRQFSLPTLTRGAAEIAMFSGVFVAASLYMHSAYGFMLAAMLLLPTIVLFLPQLLDPRFIFFFLFFAFFVTGALRPLISGTDFMDGGGRRIN